jgi:uncharacterized protein YbjQ (UPF0145 family)
MKRVALSSLNSIRSANFQEIGLVQGQCVQTRNIAMHIITSFRFLVGGEMITYDRLLKETRQKALSEMIEEAEKVGADAVIGIRLQNSSITEGACETMAYGTAVKYTHQ